jgi:hypothetical protein
MKCPNQISAAALIEIENELNRCFKLSIWRAIVDPDKVSIYFWTAFPYRTYLPDPEQISRILNLHCSWEDQQHNSYKIESGKIIYSAEIEHPIRSNRYPLYYQDVYEISGSDQEFVGRYLDGLEICCNSQDPECDCFYHYWEPDVDYADCDVKFKMMEEEEKMSEIKIRKFVPNDSIEDCKKRADKLCHNDDSISGIVYSDKDARRICILVDYIRKLEKRAKDLEIKAWKEYKKGEDAERRYNYKEAASYYGTAFSILSDWNRGGLNEERI